MGAFHKSSNAGKSGWPHLRSVSSRLSFGVARAEKTPVDELAIESIGDLAGAATRHTEVYPEFVTMTPAVSESYVNAQLEGKGNEDPSSCMILPESTGICLRV